MMHAMKLTPPTLLATAAICVTAVMELEPHAAAADGKPGAAAAASGEEDEAALALGRSVLAVRLAIENPQTPGALDAVRALGTDSRHYVMVRGWLSEQLRADRSIRDASREKTPRNIMDRIAFLEKAIRAIDLE